MLDVETADPGGRTTITLHRDLGSVYPQPTLIVGWDAKGPLATLNSGLGAQAPPLSAHFFGQDLGGAPLIHLSSDGTHLDRIGGSDCLAVDEIADGTVVCGSYDSQQFSVRNSTGATLWQATLPSDVGDEGPWLSPDGNAIAVRGFVLTPGRVASAPRLNGASQPELFALGWLDTNTVVEATLSAQLSLYNAHGLTLVRELGASGIFEGVL